MTLSAFRHPSSNPSTVARIEDKTVAFTSGLLPITHELKETRTLQRLAEWPPRAWLAATRSLPAQPDPEPRTNRRQPMPCARSLRQPPAHGRNVLDACAPQFPASVMFSARTGPARTRRTLSASRRSKAANTKSQVFALATLRKGHKYGARRLRCHADRLEESCAALFKILAYGRLPVLEFRAGRDAVKLVLMLAKDILQPASVLGSLCLANVTLAGENHRVRKQDAAFEAVHASVVFHTVRGEIVPGQIRQSRSRNSRNSPDTPACAA